MGIARRKAHGYAHWKAEKPNTDPDWLTSPKKADKIFSGRIKSPLTPCVSRIAGDWTPVPCLPAAGLDGRFVLPLHLVDGDQAALAEGQPT
jgi:hypothetical protein